MRLVADDVPLSTASRLGSSLRDRCFSLVTASYHRYKHKSLSLWVCSDRARRVVVSPLPWAFFRPRVFAVFRVERHNLAAKNKGREHYKRSELYRLPTERGGDEASARPHVLYGDGPYGPLHNSSPVPHDHVHTTPYSPRRPVSRRLRRPMADTAHETVERQQRGTFPLNMGMRIPFCVTAPQMLSAE